ncbi:MAG: hypothetical protein ACOC46_01105, partial [Pirellulales bacterium]
IHGRFASGRYGLNRSAFAGVRRALVRYVQLVGAREDEDFREVYREYLDSLAARLERYRSDPSPEAAQPIGAAVGALQTLGQAPALRRALRARYTRPNLRAVIREPVVTAGLNNPVDRTAPVRDLILGTTVRGTGRTTGETTASLAASDRHAVIDLTFLGVNRSNNRGFNRPVTIYSRGTTGVGARTRLYMNATGLHALTTRANAHTKTNISAICDRRGRRLVERIAWKRAGRQKCLAEAIAASHAEQRARARIDAEVDDALTKVNEAFIEKFRRPLARRGLFPRTLAFSSTGEAVHVVWLQAAAGDIAAADEPPPPNADVAVGICLHESMVNNMAQMALGGMTVHEELVQADVKRLLGRLPRQLQTPPGDERWGVRFARRLPVELDLSKGRFTITLRGRKYYKGDQRHPGMDVSAAYQIAAEDEAFRAVRRGELRIFPPGFDPETDRLSTRQQVIRTLLRKRFSGIFEEEIALGPLEMPGEWSKLGELPPAQFEARGDWLLLGWKLPAGAVATRARGTPRR